VKVESSTLLITIIVDETDEHKAAVVYSRVYVPTLDIAGFIAPLDVLKFRPAGLELKVPPIVFIVGVIVPEKLSQKVF
tara:strand:+ start:301 stop:534 length:234 start_codon:yes stop_codon:yes gene_type:complete